MAIEINKIPNAFINGSINISAIDKAIKSLKGVRIDDLKLVDLMFCACHCNGVYLFCDKGGVLTKQITPKNAFNNVGPTSDVVYVGKTSSRSFVERIAAHFAPRSLDFMNTIMNRIAEIIYGTTNDNAICDSFDVASKLYLKIIIFDKCDNGVPFSEEDLESELFYNYYPSLNKILGVRKKQISEHDLLYPDYVLLK